MNEVPLGGGFIGTQVGARLEKRSLSLTPPLPDKLSIEINNSCNHACFFCPNPTMTRQRRVMDDATIERVMRQGYDAGIRQVSFYSTGEPFLNKKLPDYVRRAKQLGYTYVYLSTNGGRQVSRRLRPVLEAGLDSLKFSINAGDRETYALVHGEDDFDEVMANVRLVSDYRRTVRPMKLFVSFVETPLSNHSFGSLQAAVGDLVDEVVRYPFIVIGTPLKHRVVDGVERPFIGYGDVDRGETLNRLRTTLPCYQLWSYLNVTVEGYLSACCSDFNNDLVVGNLNRTSLLEAWHSAEFRALRQRHVERKIAGTLCHGCIAQRELPSEPLNAHLFDAPEARPAKGAAVAPARGESRSGG
ncbi:MAG: radical SAM/SPASM domain-containing protein [Alphaproteobacteria bacterium]